MPKKWCNLLHHAHVFSPFGLQNSTVKNCILIGIREIAPPESGFHESPRFVEGPCRSVRLPNLQKNALAPNGLGTVEKLLQKLRPEALPARCRTHNDVLQFPLRPLMPRHQKAGNRSHPFRIRPCEHLFFSINDQHQPRGQGGPTSRQRRLILSLAPVSRSLALTLQVDHGGNVGRSGQANVQLWSLRVEPGARSCFWQLFPPPSAGCNSPPTLPAPPIPRPKACSIPSSRSCPRLLCRSSAQIHLPLELPLPKPHLG